MHVSAVRNCCLRDGIGRASDARTPAVTDERGPHTRPGDVSSSTRGYSNASLKPYDSHRNRSIRRSRRILRAGIRYEYRSLKRFAQELRLGMPCDQGHTSPSTSGALQEM